MAAAGCGRTCAYEDGASGGPGWSSSSDSEAMTPLSGRERFSEKAALHSDTGGDRGGALRGVPGSTLAGGGSATGCTAGRGVSVSAPMVSAPRSESVRKARLSCILGGWASATESGPASGLWSSGDAVTAGEGDAAVVDGLAFAAMRALRVCSLEKGCMLGRSAGVLRSDSMEPGMEDLAQYAARTSSVGISGTESMDAGWSARADEGPAEGVAVDFEDKAAAEAVMPEGGRGGASRGREVEESWPELTYFLREDGRGVGRGVETGVVRGVVRGVVWGDGIEAGAWDAPWEADDVGCRLYDGGGSTVGGGPCSIRGPPSAARSIKAAWVTRRLMILGCVFLALGGRGIICSCASVE